MSEISQMQQTLSAIDELMSAARRAREAAGELVREHQLVLESSEILRQQVEAFAPERDGLVVRLRELEDDNARLKVAMHMPDAPRRVKLRDIVQAMDAVPMEGGFNLHHCMWIQTQILKALQAAGMVEAEKPAVS